MVWQGTPKLINQCLRSRHIGFFESDPGVEIRLIIRVVGVKLTDHLAGCLELLKIPECRVHSAGVRIDQNELPKSFPQRFSFTFKLSVERRPQEVDSWITGHRYLIIAKSSRAVQNVTMSLTLYKD